MSHRQTEHNKKRRNRYRSYIPNSHSFSSVILQPCYNTSITNKPKTSVESVTDSTSVEGKSSKNCMLDVSERDSQHTIFNNCSDVSAIDCLADFTKQRMDVSEKDHISYKNVNADLACFQRGDYCLFNGNIVTVECRIQSDGKNGEQEYAVRPLNGPPFLVSDSQLSPMRDFRVNNDVKTLTQMKSSKKCCKRHNGKRERRRIRQKLLRKRKHEMIQQQQKSLHDLDITPLDYTNDASSFSPLSFTSNNFFEEFSNDEISRKETSEEKKSYH